MLFSKQSLLSFIHNQASGYAAVYFMVVSALAFALMSACVKLVSQLGIPVLEIVAARALVSLLLSYASIKMSGLSVWGNNKPLLVVRGVVGAFALMCVYYSVTSLPLAEATIIQYLHPVFTAILAYLFLREQVSLATFACIILSLLGLIVMVNPNLLVDGWGAIKATHLPMFSVFVGLLGALGSSIAYVLVRRLSRTDAPSVIVFYFPLVALPISLILLGDEFVIPSAEALMLLLFVGCFTQVGQISLTKAIRLEKTGKATAYSYVQVIFAALFGWLLLGELPSVYTYIGGGLIILGALINVFYKREINTIHKV